MIQKTLMLILLTAAPLASFAGNYDSETGLFKKPCCGGCGGGKPCTGEPKSDTEKEQK